jgi:toxin ParE1/3/4
VAPRERRVIWAESARVALDEVVSYIAEDSRANAFRVLQKALAAASILSTMGERGRIVPELEDDAVREVFVFRYRLMYRVHSNRIEIVAFVHGARDFARLREGEHLE